MLSNRLRELAFLNAGAKITIIDEREDKKHTFHYQGGINEFVKFLNANKKVAHVEPISFSKAKEDVTVDFAIQYNEDYSENVYSFVNNIKTPEGGTHLAGFRSALTRVINDYIRKYDLLKGKNFNVTGDDVREGLCAVLSCKIPNPQFEGQTKAKLGNAEIEGIVKSLVGDALVTFFEENPQQARAICGPEEKQWKMTVSGAPSARSTSSTSASASRLWIIRGLPVRLARSMCQAKDSRWRAGSAQPSSLPGQYRSIPVSPIATTRGSAARRSSSARAESVSASARVGCSATAA